MNNWKYVIFFSQKQKSIRVVYSLVTYIIKCKLPGCVLGCKMLIAVARVIKIMNT